MNEWCAVGPEDGEGWIAVKAKNEAEAKDIFAEIEDCSTEYLSARIVEEWKGLNVIRPQDWLKAGLSFSCTTCNGQASFEEDPPGSIINDSVYCGTCVEDGSYTRSTHSESAKEIDCPACNKQESKH